MATSKKKIHYISALSPLFLQFGVSKKKMFILSTFVGSHPKNIILKLKRFQNSFIRQHFDLEFFSTFRERILKRLLFFWNLKLYRGIRHMLRLPVRGQRTHTNARTKKKFKVI